jgi:hypothetical protein
MFRALLHREWRDVRAVTIAAALVTIPASLALNHWFLHWKEGALTAMWVVPAIVALYLAVVAADLVGGEVATRRIDGLAVLPTGLLRVWTAKATLLAVTGVVFLLWTVAAELGLLAVWGQPNELDAFLAALSGAAPHLAVAAALAAVTLFFSTVFERGFTAVLVSVLVVGVGVYGWTRIDWRGMDLRPDPLHLLWTAAALGLVFAVGSAMAFVRGPIHAASVLRRVSVGAIVPLGVISMTTVTVAGLLHSWNSLEPGDTDVVIQSAIASPDGAHVALAVSRVGRPNLNRTWIQRVEDGRIVVLRTLPLEWDGPSGLCVPNGSSIDVVHPDTGFVVRSIPAVEFQQSLSHRDARWARTRWLGPDHWVCEWPERGVSREYKGHSHGPHPSVVPGKVVHTFDGPYSVAILDVLTGEDVVVLEAAGGQSWHFYLDAGHTIGRLCDGVLTFVDIATGARRVLPAPEGVHQASSSPHGRWLTLWSPAQFTVLAPRDGTVVFEIAAGYGAWWPRNRDDDRFAVLFHGPDPTYLLDLEKGTKAALEPNPNELGWIDCDALPGDRFLVKRAPGVLDVVDTKGRTIRRLYPPDR